MTEIVSGLLKLDASPFLDKGYLFKRLTMSEELGDDSVASGTISFTAPGLQGSMEDATSSSIVRIKLDQTDGIQYDITGFIVDRRFLENEVEFDFLSVTKEFLSDTRWITHENIFTALDTAYPSNKIIEVESDINNDIPVRQMGESDFSLCKRLAQCYRYDSMYAFGIEGLIIKDTRLTKEEIEQSKELSDTRIIYQDSKAVATTDTELSYVKFMDMEPEDCTISDMYFDSYGYNQSYMIVGRDSNILLRNYLHNMRYRTQLYSTVNLRYIRQFPQYKLGDVVLYKNKINDLSSRYIVRSMKTTLDYQNLSIDVVLSGLDKYEG